MRDRRADDAPRAGRDLVDRLHAVVHERRRCDAPNPEVVVQREHAHRAARPPVFVDLLGGPHRSRRRVDDRRVPRDALPHRGTRRHDHEVRTLEPEQERVELVIPARDPDDLGVAPVHRLELVERRLEGVEDAGERLAHSALRHLEHHRLGAVQRLRDVVRRVVSHLGDVARDADQPPQQRELVDDARVVTGVRRRRRRRLDPQQRGAPTDGVEQLGAAQLLGDGDRVDGLALAVQRHDRFVDVDVRGLVVIARFDVRFDGRGDRVAREQHRSEERLFGFEVVRRDAPRPLPTRVIDRLDHAAPFLPPGSLERPGPHTRALVSPLPVRRPSHEMPRSASSSGRPVDR